MGGHRKKAASGSQEERCHRDCRPQPPAPSPMRKHISVVDATGLWYFIISVLVWADQSRRWVIQCLSSVESEEERTFIEGCFLVPEKQCLRHAEIAYVLSSRLQHQWALKTDCRQSAHLKPQMCSRDLWNQGCARLWTGHYEMFSVVGQRGTQGTRNNSVLSICFSFKIEKLGMPLTRSCLSGHEFGLSCQHTAEVSRVFFPQSQHRGGQILLNDKVLHEVSCITMVWISMSLLVRLSWPAQITWHFFPYQWLGHLTAGLKIFFWRLRPSFLKMLFRYPFHQEISDAPTWSEGLLLCAPGAYLCHHTVLQSPIFLAITPMR